MLFEITNPSDPYTMRTDSFAAALMAVAVLGEGRYGQAMSEFLSDWWEDVFLLSIAAIVVAVVWWRW